MFSAYFEHFPVLTVFQRHRRSVVLNGDSC